MSPRSRRLSSRAAGRLTLDAEPYLSCDDCFEQVDVQVDALVSGVSESLPPAFRAHLIGCAACRAEARTLLDLAAHEVGADRDTLLAHFDRELAAGTDLL
jgi:hypothetical protein